jgi:hypothetical protein
MDNAFSTANGLGRVLNLGDPPETFGGTDLFCFWASILYFVIE